MICRSCRSIRTSGSRSFFSLPSIFSSSTSPSSSSNVLPIESAPTTNTLPSPPVASKASLYQPQRKHIIAREKEVGATSQVLKSSLKKLGKLSALINHRRVDDAIIQMKFCNKRQAPEVMNLLKEARDTALKEGMDKDSLVVDQAWVTKGIYVKQLWPKGRGRMAIRRRPRVKIDVRLRDKTTMDRRAAEKRAKMMRKLSKRTGLIERPIYNSAVFTC